MSGKLWGRFLVFASVLVVGASLAGAKTGKDDGFRKLFNGKDLSGWTTTGNWMVEDGGVLAIKPRKGERGWQRYGAYLWTEIPHGDFTLDLEYKLPPRGNSGVFIRVKDRKNPVKTGIEVQILDSHSKKGKLGPHDCGGVIGTVGPSKNMSKPAGQWNRMIITCRGSHMDVSLNGEPIIDLDLSTSKVKDRPLRGYIGLQDHGQLLWFRNIRFKEIE
ncbi:MAG: DUF1080 domain-containing protein [Phycisphaerae bacterium]|nr:DUF1080 domain-containing protein [Phycisphaerae bacterium]